MGNKAPRNTCLFTIDKGMQSISTSSTGLINTFSDFGEEFVTEQSYSESIDLRFRIEGPLNNPLTLFGNEDAARLFALS